MNRTGRPHVSLQVDTVSVDGEELLRTLFREHAGALLSYALRLCGGDRQRAEDIVQETLLRAWRNPDAVAPSRGSPRPWLYTVARNIAVDEFRARRARPSEDGDDTLAGIAVGDGVDRALESWLVADALAALPEHHRSVLVETYYRGQSVAQAAASLGIPPGTVKSRTFHALRGLRVLLVERGVTV